MMEPRPNPYDRGAIGDNILDIWQSTVDLLAAAMSVPTGLVMRVDQEQIEVFVSSRTEGNPYDVGDTEHYLDSGLYCEWGVNHEEPLVIPDARLDADWDQNPDIKLGMVSYLGVPIRRPDGGVFGTLCVLDSDHKRWSQLFRELITQMRALLEGHLRILYDTGVIDRMETELEGLKSLLPICGHCKDIRKDDDTWVPIEHYLIETAKERPSHGICPPCLDKHYAEFTD